MYIQREIPGLTSAWPHRFFNRAGRIRAIEHAEKRNHIVDVLRDTRWVLGGANGAAARLGLPRTTLVYRMRKRGIAREQGSKCFRGRRNGLPDSPAEFSPD